MIYAEDDAAATSGIRQNTVTITKIITESFLTMDTARPAAARKIGIQRFQK